MHVLPKMRAVPLHFDRLGTDMEMYNGLKLISESMEQKSPIFPSNSHYFDMGTIDILCLVLKRLFLDLVYYFFVEKFE